VTRTETEVLLPTRLITVTAETPLFFSSATIAFAWAVAFETVVPVVLTAIETAFLDALTTAAVLASEVFAAGVMLVLPIAMGALTVISGAEIKTGLATTDGVPDAGASMVGASTAGLVVDSVGLAATGTGAGVFCC
jgi:hypothetical protein